LAFETGVSSYVIGIATVEVPFPVDHRGNPHVCCAMCRYYSRSSVRCRLNGEVTEFPDKYIGSHCPLIFEEKENTNVPDDQ
jgi:hypothetical protein